MYNYTNQINPYTQTGAYTCTNYLLMQAANSLQAKQKGGSGARVALAHLHL